MPCSLGWFAASFLCLVLCSNTQSSCYRWKSRHFGKYPRQCKKMRRARWICTFLLRFLLFFSSSMLSIGRLSTFKSIVAIYLWDKIAVSGIKCPKCVQYPVRYIIANQRFLHKIQQKHAVAFKILVVRFGLTVFIVVFLQKIKRIVFSDYNSPFCTNNCSKNCNAFCASYSFPNYKRHIKALHNLILSEEKHYNTIKNRQYINDFV